MALKIEAVENIKSLMYYKNFGNHFLEKSEIKKGKRYQQVEIEIANRKGKKITDTVTLSQPSCEILTLLKKDGIWHMVLGKQPHSSYIVVAFGTLYSKVFLEQATGVVREGENFLEAAIEKTKRELGAELIYISELVHPRLYRHVAHTNEMTKIYLAVAEQIEPEKVDENQNRIEICTIPLADVKTAFMEYIDGERDDFFGFDIPDITMLSMSIFFWKLDTGKIRLGDLKRNLL